MKIAYNPKTAAVITAATAVNDDILFDLNARKVWAKGLRMGADWADISSKPSSLKNPATIKFRDINGSEVSYDGSVAKDLTTGTYTARLPYGFSSFDSKPTWGSTTGTSIACWNDASGGSIDFRKDNPSSGKMSIKVDGRVYVNEGTNPVLSAERNNNYWGMRTPDGGNDWIRTPNSGLLPYINGNAGSGHSSLGTNSWYFSTAYIDKVYGSLKGNADTASNADKLDDWHKDNIQWTGYISSNTKGLQSYWFKMYDATITSKMYNDITITFLVSEGYGGNFSIFYLKVRQNGADSGAYNLSVTLCELVGNLKNKIVAYYNNKTGNVQLWGDAKSQYGTLNYTILKKTERVAADFTTLGTLTAKVFTEAQSQPTTDYTKVTMSRVGQVQYAESSSSSTQATKLQTARKLWGNSFDGTKDINGSIVFPAIGDTATSSKISWSGASYGADIYYQTTAKDQGNLVLNVKDDANAYIQLALNGVFKSHFDVANSYWTGKSALADKWATARTFTIGNTAKNVDGSGNVSWTLAEIGVRDTWRTVQVNGTSIGNNTLNLCGSTYIGLTNVNGKVTFSLVGSSTTANQAILSNGTANGWTLKTLNIANWDTAYNLRHSHANKSVLDGITTGLVTNWNTAYTFVSTITGTDTDNVINKWDEIVNFLAGITEDNKLNTLLNNKLSVYKLADETNVGAIKNNGIYYSTSDASSNTLTNSPFNNGFTLINMTSLDGGDDLRRSRLAFNAFGEIKVSDDRNQANTAETWYNVLTSNNSGISGSTIKLNGTSITVYSSGTADGRYVKKSGDTMTGALNFANNIWNKVGDDSYIGDCNRGGHFGIKALSATHPGIAFFNNSGAHLGNLTAYSGNIKYGAYSLQFLDNGNTSVVGSTWMNPFSAYDKDAVKDGQAVCVWGQSSSLGNLSSDGGNIALYLRRVSASIATLNMILDGEYYANGNQRLAHVSEIPTSLKNPHSLTLKANGTTLATYDGSSAKEANFTYANVGAAPSQHTHDCLVVNAADDTLFNSAYSNFQVLYAGGSNGITGKPANVDAFCLFRFRVAGGWSGQMLFANGGSLYIRSAVNANFNNKLAWRQIIDSTTIGQQSVKYATSAGSATSATKVIVNQHTANDSDYPLVWSNQSDTSNATENQLYKSWQDLYYNPKNKRLFVGGAVSTAYINATNTVTSAGFKHSGVTKNADQYVLTAGGGYTFLNQASNELAHEFNVSIAVTSEWQDIAGFHGGSQTFLTQPGTYIVQVYYQSNPADGMYQGYFSGIMSWYTGTTNSNNADEIVLHRVGHAYANTIYLRTRESLKGDPDPYTKLQISANSNLKEHTYKFKFKRIC